MKADTRQSGISFVRFLAALVVLLLAESAAAPAQVKTNVPANAELAAPAGIVLNFSAGDVIVAWNAAKGATGYEVMRTTDPLQPPVKLATLARTSLGYHDHQVGSGPVYFYQVVSVGADGARAPSAFYKFVVPVRAAPAGGGAATSIGLPQQPALTPGVPVPAGTPIGLPQQPTLAPAVPAPTGTPIRLPQQLALAVASPEMTATPTCSAPGVPVPAGAPIGLPQQTTPAPGLPVPAGTPIRLPQQPTLAPAVPVPAGTPISLPAHSTLAVTPAGTAGSTVTNLAVTATTETTVTLSLTCAVGASGYRVYRSVYGSSYNLVTTLASGLARYTDPGLISNVAYSYQASAIYPTGDGPLGGAVTGKTKPGLPPARLSARLLPTEATSADAQADKESSAASAVASSDPSAPPTVAAPTVAVQLDWPAAAEAAGYLVFRDGTPLMQSTSPVTDLSYTDTAVPTGVHTYQVASIFKTADQEFVEGELAGLPSATVLLSYGVYRLLLTQITANQATNDTPLSLDGKGDEVYVTSDIYLISEAGAAPQQSLRSWTFGDINNQSDRVMAGSLSNKGGIQSGDTIPGPAGACFATAPSHLCIPMEIFRGQLVQDALGVYIIPRLWEWDGWTNLFADLADPLVASRGQVVKNVSLLVKKAVLQATAMSRQRGGYVPLSFGQLFPTTISLVNLSTLITGSTWLFQPGPLELLKPACSDFCQDRPIGIHDAANGQIAFDDIVIPLSYDLAEGLVSGSLRFPGVGVGEFPMIINDDNKYGGIYTLTFRVERCVSMTQC